MKIQFNKKTVSLIAVITLLLAVIIGIFVPKKQIIAFYDLSEFEVSGLKRALEAQGQDVFNPKKFKYIEYDNSLALEKQLSRKPSILFARGGSEFNRTITATGTKTNLVLTGDLSGLTSSMKGLVLARDKNIAAVPVLSSNMEIAVNMNLYRRSRMTTISTWSDIEKFAEISKNREKAGIMFDCKNADNFLDMTGALIESFDGRDAYHQAVKIINDTVAESSTFNSGKIVQNLMTLEGSPLNTTVQTLKRWDKKGLLLSGTFNAAQTDVNSFMKNDNVSLTFITLSTHRQIPRDTIERYTSIYLPSDIAPSLRAFTAPAVYAAAFKKNKKTVTLFNALISKEGQEKLCAQTGFAPVLAQCKTVDRQADDARYWVAATNPPLQGLSRDITLTAEQKEDLSKSIQAAVRFN